MFYQMKALRVPLLLLLAVAGHSIPSMTVQQPKDFTHTARVAVEWEGIPPTSNSTSDWVSVWWVPFQATYVQYINVTHASSGSGSAEFDLINARHPFYFRYYRNDRMLAQSQEIYPDGAYPNQLRLSVVEHRENAMRVSWTSNRSTGLNTVVQYGTDPQRLYHEVVAEDTTYTHDMLSQAVYPNGPNIPVTNKAFPNIGSRKLRCGADCWQDNTSSLLFVDPGIFHGAVLRDLEPRTQYFYRVGEKNGVMSEVYYFYSRPSNFHTTDDTLSIVYFADGGVGGNGDVRDGFEGGACNNDPPLNGGDTVWAAVTEDQKTAKDDLMLFNGDISYARGWPYTWELFHNQTTPFMRHIAGVYSYGNHEFDNANSDWKQTQGHDSGGEAGIVTSLRYQIDSKPTLVNFGPVAIITLSSEHRPLQQALHLQELLDTINRKYQPWVIVQIHRPLYSSNPSSITGVSKILQKRLTPVLEDPANGVDLVLMGHAHYYERMCAIRDGECQYTEKAPVYIIDGSAGAEFEPTSTPDSPITEYKDFLIWGYSRIHVNSTALTWHHMHTHMPGVPVDSVTLVK